MGSFNYKKLMWALLYLSFGSFSCWATAESLFLTWPDIPLVFCWVISIGFFLIASLGCKMIADAFDHSKYIKNRSFSLWMGLLIICVFWLICSMPTNTHTFLYRDIAASTVTEDIQSTSKYLNQLATNEFDTKACQQEKEQLKHSVQTKLNELWNEMSHSANVGVGPAAKKIMLDIAGILSDGQLGVPSVKNNKIMSEQELVTYFKDYSRLVNGVLNARLSQIDREYSGNTNRFAQVIRTATNANKNLAILKKALDDGDYDINEAKTVNKQIIPRLNEGYSLVKNYSSKIVFNPLADKAHYENDGPFIKHIIGVYNLWGDFLSGNLPSKTGSMIFYILISILVDIAAFIFFTKI